MRHTKVFLQFFLLAAATLFGQTISEKKASLVSGASGDLSREMQRFLIQVNNEMAEQKALLRELYEEARALYAAGASEEEYRDVLARINAVKDNIKILENSWRKMAAQNNQEEEYALWHQPETTLGDLVIDYGSQDYVYLFTPELGEMPVSISSNIPIPRASWSEMLETILNQNGIGINQVNPYLRELYRISEENPGVQLITDKRSDLELYPDETRVSFVISPDPADVRRIWYFLDKFVNHQSTDLQVIGRDILIIATASEVRELLKLYDFVAKGGKDSEYKIVPLHRVDAEEMGNILTAIFDQFMNLPENEQERGREYRGSNGLRVITLSHVARALFLIGTEEEIGRAEEIIRQVESEVGEAREKVVFTYTCKHADTEELAEILEKVYGLMAETGAGYQKREDNDEVDVDMSTELTEINVDKEFKTPQQLYQDGFYQEGGYIVNPAPVQPGMTQQTNPHPNRGRNNFIIDPKTGAIVMVVDALALPKLKDLIRKLDVPKKMVQIEVLLFEKKQDSKMRYGLNLLNIGSKASQTRQSAIVFNDQKINPEPGILDFCLSRMKSSVSPAFDLVYKFLLSQDDVSINANPTVLAINQTTAMINVVDEISINTGVYQVETAKGVTLKDSFTRAQYGITIKVTPTVHITEEEGAGCVCLYDEEGDYVTLDTDITFETPQSVVENSDRPDVAIRHVQNMVRIPNGQAVILGGLRRKIKEDSKDSIPLLGEMPYLGKLFSETVLNDKSTELFIMLTPTIVSDPGCELKQIRCQQMMRRPGDIPSYLCRLERARECEKKRLFRGYLTMLLGRPPERCYRPPGEYDGRCR